MSMRVLIVDDEPSILAAMAPLLRSRGYDVSTARSGRGALDAVERDHPDLIVLDLGLADTDGIEVCRLIRDGNATPIIVLSARGKESDKVAALDAGADDYVTKPFGTEELMARIRVMLRRNAPPAEQLAFADLALDLDSGVARRGGQELDLTRREAELLELLLRNPRVVITRERALEEVWGGEGEATFNAVDRYVAYLRRKLGEPPLIHTVRGVGFRLDRS